MTLTWPVVLAVLMGALLHASWNALVKSSSDKALDTALIHLLGSLGAIPLVLVLGFPPAQAWPWLLTSVVVHVAYYFALSQAYQHGDLGLTYPLMRGTAPMLVAITSVLVVGEALSAGAWLGVLAISLGVLTLGLSRHALDSRRALAFALTNAFVIASYTFIDAVGARTTVQSGGQVMQYVATLFMLDGWPFGLLVLARRRQAAWPYISKRWPVALGGAIASLGSYGIALWAMTQAPVATVAALRETSVLFAAFFGIWFLGESLTLRRIAGTVVIVIGVVLLRLTG